MDVNIKVPTINVEVKEDSIQRLENLTDVDLSGAVDNNVLFLYEGVWTAGNPVVDGSVEWDSILNRPLEFPAEAHTHAIEDVTGLDEALDEKLDASQAFSGEYGDLQNTPLDFAPAPHTHEIEDIEGLDDALFSGSYNDLEDVPGTFTPSAHNHEIADVTGLSDALNSKQDAATAFDGDYDSLSNVPATFTPASHNHAIGEVTNLQTALNDKLDVSAAFDGDYDSLSNLPTLFEGDYGDLYNVPSTFPPSNHTHNRMTVSGTGGTSGRVVRISAANTFTDASQADTIDQLSSLFYKDGEDYLLYGSLVSGLSGLTPGAVYYLSTSGNITTTAPTPSSSVRMVRIGTALSATELVFTPGTPIGGE